ncbi:MAG TPA: MFS transporter [Thermomicrobiaceae bacterium]|nr:MFS transporter [Thermomicrobiaceae bacterium]
MTSPAAARRRAPIAALLAANLVSMVGNVLAMVAIPWYVLLTTHSAARTGVTLAVAAVPQIVAGALGGTLVDRLGFRRASVLADLASGLTIGLIPLLAALGHLAFWELLVFLFCGVLFDAPGGAARQSLIPDLAALGDVGLERVNSAAQVVQRSSNLLGAPLAGVLIAVAGPSSALWIDAASFLVSAALVAALVPAILHDRPAGSTRGRYLEELRDAARFIRADALLLALTFTLTATNLLDASLSVVLPVFAERVYGSAVALGLMAAALGGGAVVGALVYAVLSGRLPRRATFIGGFAGLGLGYWALAGVRTLPLTVAVLAVMGLAAGPLNPLLYTLYQERIPALLRGRVFGMLTAASWAAIPLGRLVSGSLLDGVGLSWTLIAVAVGYLATVASMAVNPYLRRLDARDAPFSPGSGTLESAAIDR